VLLHYTGWNSEGDIFTTSVTRDGPARVPLYRRGQVLQKLVGGMTPGELSRFWVTTAKNDAVVYEIELLDIVAR
jgi:FKBP-type peptidyl-prolyl cis-trans isomerase